jgi:hypothetical protein
MKTDKNIFKKGLAALLMLFLATSFSFAQDKYFVTFYGSDGGTAGHAFIAFGKEIADPGMSVDEGAWGLYPDNSIAGGASVILGPVPGQIKSDAETIASNDDKYGIQIEVSKEDYEKAKSIRDKWDAKGTYQLVFQDCVSFISEVAEQLDSVTVPQRINNIMPVDYILKFIEKNKD